MSLRRLSLMATVSVATILLFQNCGIENLPPGTATNVIASTHTSQQTSCIYNGSLVNSGTVVHNAYASSESPFGQATCSPIAIMTCQNGVWNDATGPVIPLGTVTGNAAPVTTVFAACQSGKRSCTYNNVIFVNGATARGYTAAAVNAGTCDSVQVSLSCVNGLMKDSTGNSGLNYSPTCTVTNANSNTNGYWHLNKYYSGSSDSSSYCPPIVPMQNTNYDSMVTGRAVPGGICVKGSTCIRPTITGNAISGGPYLWTFIFSCR